MPSVSPQQRALRRQQIIDGAFETWGRSVFYHTRLDDLAERFSITKPALYRYFSSKADLLAAMEEQLLAAYARLGAKLQADAATLPADETAARFIRERIAFFAEHVPQFFFTLHLLNTHRDGPVVRALAAHMQVLSETLARLPGIHDPATAASYVRTTVSFFLMAAGLNKETLRHHPLSSERHERLASTVEHVCMQGYARRGAAIARPPMEAIERACAVGSADLPPDDPILRAVAETVAEHGFAEASIERIARRAGLTKSSLYFHFRDRDEMFGRLIERNEQRLHELFTEKAGAFASVWERLYCYLVVLGSYLHNAQAIPAVLNWFRTHGYQIDVRHPEETMMNRWFAFLDEAVRDGSLAPQGLSVGHLGSHLSYVVMNRLVLADRSDPARLADLRQIYDLFLHGIQGGRP